MTTKIRQQQRQENIIGWLCALPHLLLFALFLLLPVVGGFYLSLHRWHVLSPAHPFVGFSNYAAALHDDIFWVAVKNTVLFTLMVVPVSNLVSLLLALGIYQVRTGSVLYRVLFYLPVVTSISVVAVLWRWLAHTQVGLMNLTLRSLFADLRHLGLPLPAFDGVPWLSNPAFVLPTIALMTVWWTAGGNMILYLAGRSGVSEDYYEAAIIDGAGIWARFRAITWPLLRPTTIFCLVFSILGSFQVFGQSYVLFAPGAGPSRSGLTLALYMYQQGFSQYEVGYGAAIAYLLFAMVLAVTWGLFRLFAASARGEEAPQ